MKNLQELLVDIDESVLDNDILDQYSPSNMTDKMKEILLFKYPKEIPGCDAYGRTLEVGDWVVCVPPGKKSTACQVFGIVSKMTAKRITIQIRADVNFTSYTHSSLAPKLGQYWLDQKTGQSPYMTVNVSPSMVFKITNKEEFLSTVH